jgi:hypothetical protein
VVELPVDPAWSGDRSFDLADPVQRYLYHVAVLTSAATREHYTSWLNAGCSAVTGARCAAAGTADRGSVQARARWAVERDEAAVTAWREETWPVIKGG